MTEPGLIVNAGSGEVEEVNIGFSGTLNILGFTLMSPATNPVTFQYSAAEDLYELSGQVSAPELFNATVTMGTAQQPGIVIKDGKWSVDDLKISLSDVNLGAFDIKEFDVTLMQSGTTLDLEFFLDVKFPQGWEVEADIDMQFNTAKKSFVIEKVFIEWQSDPNNEETRIPIGDTGLFLTEMDATVNNLNNLTNLTVQGDARAEFGDEIGILGTQATIFTVDGSFFVDKDELKLDAEVFFGGVETEGKTTGILGEGTGDLLLDWAAETYSLDVKSSLYDGFFTIEEEFEFFDGGDILISAKAGVNVPKGIPFIGGKELAEFDFLFKFIPPETAGGPAGGFVAAWTRVDLLFTHVDIGFQVDFASKDARVIGSSQINADKKSASNESSQTYVYPATFTVPDGATRGTLQVTWPTAGGTQTIGVSGDGWTPAMADSQGRLLQQNFSSTQDSNWVGLIPEYTTDTTISVSLESSSDDDDFVPLPVKGGDTYTLYLFSDVKFDADDIEFMGTFHYPKPTLEITSIEQQTSGAVPYNLHFVVDEGFAANTKVDVYVDQWNPQLGAAEQAFNGTLVQKDIPVQLIDPNDPQQGGDLQVMVPVEGLFPIPYYAYAVINDGTNSPVIATVGDNVSPMFTPVFQIQGNVTNQNGDGLTGWRVFVDTDGNGSFSPDEESTLTGEGGFYSFTNDQLPSTGSVNVILQNLDETVYQYDSPSTGSFVYTANTGQKTFNYTINQVNSITGTVFDDLDGSGNLGEQPGVSGWTVFLDENNNGLLDDGEVSTLTNQFGEYTFNNVTSGDYNVRVQIMDNSNAEAMYRFEADEVDGTSVRDATGNNHNGTLIGGALVGTAASFGIEDRPFAPTGNQVLQSSGAGQFLDVPYASEFDPGTGEFSFAAWLRIVETENVLYAISGTSGDVLEQKPGWSIAINPYENGQYNLQIYLSQSTSLYGEWLSDDPIQTNGGWIHVAFTYDGTNNFDGLAVYVNGAVANMLGSNSLPSSPDIKSVNENNFNVGDAGGMTSSDFPFVGYLDDVGVWSEELTADQIQSLYRTGGLEPAFVSTTPNPLAVTFDDSTDPGFIVVDGVNFGGVQLTTISGTITGNELVNGKLDPNAVPLEGWTVTLEDTDGNVVATTTTSSNGSYLFNNILAGDYEISQRAPVGQEDDWRQTSPFESTLDFADPVTSGDGSTGVQAIAAADFDGDGYVDIATANADLAGDKVLRIYWGNGDGTFSTSSDFALSGELFSIIAFDYDQ
ncbi:MAG: VCBS repeat-containing protein, partial [Planctomycetaceae bacterium]|nr:VCBS repeat-containing protein [Planctomycetaceae bacterium]